MVILHPLLHKTIRIFNTASSFNEFRNTENYEDKPRFNGVYSRDNLPKKIKDRAYVINLGEYADTGSGIVNNDNDTKQNLQLAEELRKPIIRKFKKRKVYSGFRDNVWGADLADMQLKASLIKDLDSYYELLIFLVNMLGLFL